MANFNWNNRTLVTGGQLQQASLALFGPGSGTEPLNDSGKLWTVLGHTLVARGYLSQSLLCFQSALACEPELVGIEAIRGFVLFKLGRTEEAMTAYMAALAQDPTDADVWLNLGVLYQSANCPVEALSCFETALLQRPGFVAAWKNRAKVLSAVGDFEGALISFNAAEVLSPNDRLLRVDRAMCLLMLGDFATGWSAYEARLHIGAEPRIQTDRWPLWQGEAVAGRRVLVIAEQGIGDILQFARHIGDLGRLGAEVTLKVSERLVPLLSGLVDGCRLVSDLGLDASFDYEIPLMSLPHRLSLSEITSPDPVCYLAAAPDHVWFWGRRLQQGGEGFRVGITWQGNRAFFDDIRRSIPLARFGTLADVPGVRLISLQDQSETADLIASGLPIEHLGEDVDRDGAFLDTAAILENVDLLITSDTAIAHLAGSMGRPVWLALAHVPDWRWGMSGETTPWYPTMRLFRQKTEGDWASVFEAIRAALVEEVSR